MANTFSQCFYHFVFSTKNRAKFITPELEERIWAYIGGILKNHNLIAVQIGGIDDHIHILVLAKPIAAPSEIAKLIKGESSKWIKTNFPHLKNFAWQDGFGVFSVSKPVVPDVVEYIRNQRKHHSAKSFETEYLDLLNRHGVEYDERYLFG